MGSHWVKQGKAQGDEQPSSQIHALHIQPTTLRLPSWNLPPSKSHLIRMLLLCALSKKKHTLIGFNKMGEDAESMLRCLSQLGVKCIWTENGFEIRGVGIEGLQPTSEVMYAGNSGTALRLLIGLSSRTEFTSTIDGDASLRNRNHSDLVNALSPLGVEFSFETEPETLPVRIRGPWIGNKLSVDVSRSSQPHSSVLLATSGLRSSCIITTEGEAVSRRHSALTKELMRQSGASFEINGRNTSIAPWTSNPPREWKVPPDGSMMAFPILACVLKKESIQIVNPVEPADALGHEVLLDHLGQLGIQKHDETLTYVGSGQTIDIDLRDANDLLPPLAATLALSGGGRIRGASHAKYKESNRIKSTASLLNAFGLRCTIEQDGLSIEGGQVLSKPSVPVDTFGDHRIQMTAVLLATETGGVVEGPNLHRIADPEFLNRFSSMPAEVLVERIQR
tara:strand:- start:2069 stop:3418 length:1350 start_codon:yes stop_codon:yes gene_type:complete